MDAPAGHATFSSELDKLSLGELQEAARKVSDLKGHPGWKVVQDLLAAVYERTNLELVHFPPQHPHALYRLTGTVSGIENHRRVADSVLFAAQEREKAEQIASNE